MESTSRATRLPSCAAFLLLAVFVSPSPSPGGSLITIFGDDFESGATCTWSTYVSPTLPGGCLIDDVCYADGAINPANACEGCQASVNPTMWLNRPGGAVCAEPSCASGSEWNPPDVCNGFGACIDSGFLSCEPYACSGNACLDSCDNSSECTADNYCSSSECVPRKANGQVCTADESCQSSQCVDGVCCVSNCDGVCERCTIGTGACDAVGNGTDPQNECAQDLASSCDQDGFCSGSRSCRLWAAGTVCANAACVGGMFPPAVDPADLCDGAGLCLVIPEMDCGAYLCSAGACRTICTDDIHCDGGSGFHCDIPTQTCVPF